jgi:hypothetical protein
MDKRAQTAVTPITKREVVLTPETKRLPPRRKVAMKIDLKMARASR